MQQRRIPYKTTRIKDAVNLAIIDSCNVLIRELNNYTTVTLIFLSYSCSALELQKGSSQACANVVLCHIMSHVFEYLDLIFNRLQQ